MCHDGGGVKRVNECVMMVEGMKGGNVCDMTVKGRSEGMSVS